MKPTNTDAHQARCLRCHRVLRSATSIKAGMGAWCRARVRAAALAEALREWSEAQVEKARELIADGGIVRTNRDGIFRAVSSDGTQNYLVAVTGNCNCRAGLLARRCYHTAAAVILSARGK